MGLKRRGGLFYGKKADMNQDLLQIIGRILIVLVVIGSMFAYINSIKNQTLFERNYYARDLALLMSTIHAAPGDVSYKYPGQFTKYFLNVSIDSWRVIISESGNPHKTGYPFLKDSDLAVSPGSIVGADVIEINKKGKTIDFGKYSQSTPPGSSGMLTSYAIYEGRGVEEESIFLPIAFIIVVMLFVSSLLYIGKRKHMSKKGTTSLSSIGMIFDIIITVVVLISVVMLSRSFVLTKIDIRDTEMRLVSHRIMYSPNGISYYDSDIGRVYPGMIDVSKFNSQTFDSSLYLDDNELIAAYLNITCEDQSYAAYINKLWYERWKPLADSGKPGPGGAKGLEESRHVILVNISNNGINNCVKVICNANMYLEIITPNS